MDLEEKIGCLKKTGLKVFARTADGRYKISKDLFFATHFPMTLRREAPSATKALEEWTEEELLRQIQDIDEIGVKGENRIYFLFGATGSGKSELSKWLEAKLKETPRGIVVHRVSKTELEIPKIVEKFRAALPDHEEFKKTETHRRREKVGSMPKTTAGKILYDALYDLLESDEDAEIVKEKLLPVITKGLQQGFGSERRLDEEWGEFIEPLPREKFEENLWQTKITEKLGYEELSKKLSENIEKILLEGTSLVGTLENLSKHITERMKMRPVLLVDDIVQSLNLYVVALLDYFMDFKRGNWDVIIGITPAFLEKTKKGKDLLTRITEQSTITERVTKLLLTDLTGETSYVLNQKNYVEFITPYFLAYKKENEFICGPKCPFQSNCVRLGPEEEALAPFNSILLRRIFNGLTERTGKSRAFTQKIRDILNKVVDEKTILEVLDENIESDIRAEYPSDKRIRILAELFLSSPEGETLQVPERLLDFFGIEMKEGDSIIVPISSLREELEEGELGFGDEKEIDPRLVVIDKWLDGKELSGEERQHLFSLRNGLVSLISDFFKPGELVKAGISKPSGLLRWKGKYQGTDPPVKIEGVDDVDGVEINRSAGKLAFLIHRYGTSWEDEARVRVLGRPEFGSLLLSGTKFRQNCLDQISSQLGLDLDKLILYLYLLATGIHGPYKIVPPLLFDSDLPLSESKWRYLFSEVDVKLPYELGYVDCSFTDYQVEQIEAMFNDFYRIRENVYDGYKLKRLMEEIDDFSFIDSVLYTSELDLHRQFTLGERTLRSFLESIKKKVSKLQNLATDRKVLDQLDRFERFKQILEKIDENTITEIGNRLLKMEEINGTGLRVRPLTKKLPFPPDEFKEELEKIRLLGEQIEKHLYTPIRNQDDDPPPLLLLRFLYGIGELEKHELVRWIFEMDEKLGELENNLGNKLQGVRESETSSIKSLRENLEELEKVIIEFFCQQPVLANFDSLDIDSIVKTLKENIDSDKITRRNGKGYQELKVVAGQEYLVRIYTNSSEFESWLRRKVGAIDQNTNLIIITSFRGPYSHLSGETLIKKLLKEKYGRIAYYSWIPLRARPNLYHDTIRSPISFLITACFQNLSHIHKIKVQKLNLPKEQEKTLTEECEDNEDTANELDLVKRAEALLNNAIQITQLRERCLLIDEINNQIDKALIRQILSWDLLAEFLDPSIRMKYNIGFWIDLLSETLHTPYEISLKTPTNLKQEVSQSVKTMKALEENQRPKLIELLLNLQQYLEAINLLKTHAPELGRLFPVERTQVSELIEKIKNTNLSCPNDVYGLVREATPVREMLSSTGIEIGSLKKLKRGLSSESFELVIKILKDRKHVRLSDLNIDQLSEIMQELPEILQVIVLTLRGL